MKRSNPILSLAFFMLSLVPASAQIAGINLISPSNPNMAYIGRVVKSNPEAYSWTYPGVQIRAVFSGTSVSMRAKADCGYFMVEVDDCAPYKVKVPTQNTGQKDVANVVLAEGMTQGEHELRLTYLIEGLVKKPVFYGLVLDPGATLTRRPVLPARRMEFIGNSITCGFGIEDSIGAKKFSYAEQNHYLTYEAITARAFDAQCLVVARSGIGIYRNNNGKPSGDRDVLPAYYPYTQFRIGGEKWDFSRYQPDIVCVNLGTNDTTKPSYNVSRLTAAFKQFLVTLRGHYPKARIVLLTGTMISGKRLADVQQAQQAALEDAHARGDLEVYRLDFTPADGSLGYGTFKHPSRAQHRKMAAELIAFIESITDWRAQEQ